MSLLPERDPALPTLVIAGDRDQIAPAAAVRALAGAACRVTVVAGVDHSWWPGVETLAREIDSFLDSLRF